MIIEFFILLINTYGYLGVFIVSLLSSATIFIPVPSFVFSIGAGALLNPFFVGIAAGTGAAIGELTGYGIGIGGKIAIKKSRKKWGRLFEKTSNWFERHGGFFVIILFAATPLPDDLIGIFCGVVKYDIKKFFIATLIGKIIMNIALAYAGLYGLNFMRSFLNGF